MDAVQLLRQSSDLAYKELLSSIAELDQNQSWASVTPIEGEYLHSNGSIIGIVQHIALCRFLYAACAFTNLEIRGRDTMARVREIDTDWEKTKTYLMESHEYWLNSWSSLTSEQLEDEKGTIWNKPWPAWRLIHNTTHHDHYHAGQIYMIRSIAPPSSTPPDMLYDEEEKYVRDTHYW
jgi:hypothetical protein